MPTLASTLEVATLIFDGWEEIGRSSWAIVYFANPRLGLGIGVIRAASFLLLALTLLGTATARTRLGRTRWSPGSRLPL